MKTIGWRILAGLYGLYVLLDLVSLPVRDSFFPTEIGSILGLVGLIPLVGYAFNIRVLNNSLRKILFLFQDLVFGVLAYARLPFGDSRMDFSPARRWSFQPRLTASGRSSV